MDVSAQLPGYLLHLLAQLHVVLLDPPDFLVLYSQSEVTTLLQLLLLPADYFVVLLQQFILAVQLRTHLL